jgi:hypothetical protein
MAHDLTYQPELHGVIAEFDGPESLIEAAHKSREAGYTKIEAYTPFPVHGLSEAIGFDEAKIKWIIFWSGVGGAFAGFGLQAWVSMTAMPVNAGGKPLFSWPAFIPITFECMVLAASFGAVIGMLGLNGLPMPYHPIFEARRFNLASQDKFFLCIESGDPKFDSKEALSFLKKVGGKDAEEVVG